MLTVDPDVALAARGRTDVTALVRDQRRPWRRAAARRAAGTELLATGAELTELAGLADRAAAALGEDVATLLADWLAGAGPLDRSPS